MIGNDIVDLSLAAQDSNWKRPRFLDKVFTTHEQTIISSSVDQHQMVWLLWSMKEAAYKAYVREYKYTFFNPKRLECQLGLNNEGVVNVDEKRYITKSILTSEYIHSIAMKFETPCSEIQLFKLSNCNLSATIRMKIKSYAALKYSKNVGVFEIIKSTLGFPDVYLNNKQIFKALSITHHGDYGAFAIY
ncbi:MAG: 4-phosphopantetheinyl transferase family protein [Psychroserpens sp.]|nr:4-phosphopantetheinyl transferase family protein [Psychroserpens sp.]